MFRSNFMKVGIVYDYASFNVATGQSDYNVKTSQSATFSNVPVAKNVIVFFNKQISLKFNSTLMPAISLPVSRSPYQLPSFFLEVRNLFITNASGDTAAIEVIAS